MQSSKGGENFGRYQPHVALMSELRGHLHCLLEWDENNEDSRVVITGVVYGCAGVAIAAQENVGVSGLHTDGQSNPLLSPTWKIHVVAVYSPHDGRSEEEKAGSWLAVGSYLEALKANILAQAPNGPLHPLVLIGDCNAGHEPF